MGDRSVFRCQQGDLGRLEMYGMYGDEVGRDEPEPPQSFQWPHAILGKAFLNFGQCFVYVHMDGNVEFAGKGGDAFEASVTNGIGGVWRQCEVE